MLTFLVYTNEHKDPDLGMTRKIERYLRDRGVRCGIRLGGSKPKEAFLMDKGIDASCAGVPLEEADCLIVLGGDGTMLQAARDVHKASVPLVGVNLGTLGYMTEIEPAHLEEALDRLIAGDYQVEHRMRLHGEVVSQRQEGVEDWALNDIVISRSGSLRILKFNVSVNGQFLNDYQADGLILTTPTGSTGYNLSAGGPIVEPKAQLLMMTPICPHTLNQRSIILSPEDVVEIEVPEGKDGQAQEVEVSFDGAHAVLLKTGERIRVHRSAKTTDFIRLGETSFLEVLHRKLSEK